MEDIYDYLVPKRKPFEKKYTNTIIEVELKGKKGTLKLGGDKSLPYFSSQYKPPKIALCVPESIKSYPKPIEEMFQRVGSPFDWAMKCIDDYAPDALSLKFSVNSESNDQKLEDAAKMVEQVSKSCDLPLILDVDGDPVRTASSIDYLSEKLVQRSVLASASLNTDYKLLVEATLRNNHVLVAETDCDTPTQRTLNSKLIDLGLLKNQIVMDPTTAALGLGLEYSISIIEQLRIDGLKGDELTRFPIVLTRSAPNSWKAREAWQEDPNFPPPSLRGPIWEAHTALGLFLAGADLIVLMHPRAAEMIKQIFREEK